MTASRSKPSPTSICAHITDRLPSLTPMMRTSSIDGKSESWDSTTSGAIFPPLSRTIRLSARPLTLSRPFFKQPKSEVTKCPLNSSPSKYPEFPLVQMTASHVQHPISHKQFQQTLSRSCTLSEWIITLVLDNYYLDFINYKMIKIPTSLLLKNGPSSVSPTLHNPSYRATGP